MPRQATIYRVLIASPSDVDDERKLLKEIIFDWNASHSVDMGILLEPVMWESHVYPDLGGEPQSIVNNQIVHNADVLIGIFWTRIGTKTKSANSGTVEEIQQIVESNKPALIYFSNKQTHPDLIDFEQYQAVKEFKNYCSKAGIINTYSEHHEFRLKVTQNLSQLAFRLSSLNGDRNSNNTLPDKRMERLIFISHKEKDVELAKLLVNFILSSVDIKEDELRCTSVSGHQLNCGTTLSEQLRSDLCLTTVVFVILTYQSIRSPWFLFELGASWVFGKFLIPILDLSYRQFAWSLKGISLYSDR
ncbi:MAG: hypothetical protein HF982_00500 [Desulfobacteraceae bacterium]|nr:hypothetical protein [Desulfobacteraceae bacterium]MBC2718081.1 hypothetical protein [Desulfobacteraceae bacterium]